jgi:hypothetical protein
VTCINIRPRDGPKKSAFGRVSGFIGALSVFRSGGLRFFYRVLVIISVFPRWSPTRHGPAASRLNRHRLAEALSKNPADGLRAVHWHHLSTVHHFFNRKTYDVIVPVSKAVRAAEILQTNELTLKGKVRLYPAMR